MVKTYTTIKVEYKDFLKLDGIKKLILENHPHMKGMKMSKAYIFHQIVEISELALKQGARMIK